MKKNYLNVKFRLFEEYYPYFYVIIENFKIEGIEENFDEISVCFSSENWNETIKNELLNSLKQLIPDIEIINEQIIEDKNWNEEIEKNTPIIVVSEKIGIAPEWKLHELNTEIKIIINPKMSFGTGQHATTKLVCKLLEKVVQNGQFWIDAGTGTGILGILAMKLGARSVYAFDYDKWSVENARENFTLNNLKSNFIIEEADIFECNLPNADGIVANMYLNILDKTANKFYNALKENKGNLILSGILKYDADYIIDHYSQHLFEHVETLSEDEWVAIHLKVK